MRARARPAAGTGGRGAGGGHRAARAGAGVQRRPGARECAGAGARGPSHARDLAATAPYGRAGGRGRGRGGAAAAAGGRAAGPPGGADCAAPGAGTGVRPCQCRIGLVEGTAGRGQDETHSGGTAGTPACPLEQSSAPPASGCPFPRADTGSPARTLRGISSRRPRTPPHTHTPAVATSISCRHLSQPPANLPMHPDPHPPQFSTHSPMLSPPPTGKASVARAPALPPREGVCAAVDDRTAKLRSAFEVAASLRGLLERREAELASATRRAAEAAQGRAAGVALAREQGVELQSLRLALAAAEGELTDARAAAARGGAAVRALTAAAAERDAMLAELRDEAVTLRTKAMRTLQAQGDLAVAVA
eukprot:scaffold6266_cov68-Isochrysis_galbana.AAC.1